LLKVPLQLHCRMHVPLLKDEEDTAINKRYGASDLASELSTRSTLGTSQIPNRLRRQRQSDSYDSAYVLLRGRW
ncbi:hypothetical protein JI435_162470, partial [Parastagonospora nodorum SN15]